MEKKAILIILLIVLLLVMFAGADNIHEAVKQGDLSKTQNLVAKDRSSLDSKTEDGRTPLHVAVMGGHKEVMEYLIREGANIDSLYKLQSKAVFPMHASGDEYFYRSFAEEAADKYFRSKFICAENKGDSFILHKR